MNNLVGTVTKIRTLSFDAQPLVRFTLETNTGPVNCLIRLHSLSFIADVVEGAKVAVYGVYNDRKQLVVRKYSVLGETAIMHECAASRYPRRRA